MDQDINQKLSDHSDSTTLSTQIQQTQSQTNQRNHEQIYYNQDVRMKKHPELQPYVPTDRFSTFSYSSSTTNNRAGSNSNGNHNINNKSPYSHRSPLYNSVNGKVSSSSNNNSSGQPKRYVSMTRLNQLAQPKKRNTVTTAPLSSNNSNRSVSSLNRTINKSQRESDQNNLRVNDPMNSTSIIATVSPIPKRVVVSSHKKNPDKFKELGAKDNQSQQETTQSRDAEEIVHSVIEKNTEEQEKQKEQEEQESQGPQETSEFLEYQEAYEIQDNTGFDDQVQFEFQKTNIWQDDTGIDNQEYFEPQKTDELQEKQERNDELLKQREQEEEDRRLQIERELREQAKLEEEERKERDLIVENILSRFSQGSVS